MQTFFDLHCRLIRIVHYPAVLLPIYPRVDAADPVHFAFALPDRLVVDRRQVDPVSSTFLGDVAGRVGHPQRIGNRHLARRKQHRADAHANRDHLVRPDEMEVGHGFTQPLRNRQTLPKAWIPVLANSQKSRK